MSQWRGMNGLLEGVYAGEIRAIARMMSLAEGAQRPVHDAMGEIYRRAGRAHVVGLTGSPGSGKSTLVGALTRAVRKSGRKVGIVAVDPSSPFSGGAILGDRIRMTDLATDKGVFVRSLATRGNLGGLASASLDTVDILDAAGFDLVFIETVGVGQDEVDIARAAHTVGDRCSSRFPQARLAFIQNQSELLQGTRPAHDRAITAERLDFQRMRTRSLAVRSEHG